MVGERTRCTALGVFVALLLSTSLAGCHRETVMQVQEQVATQTPAICSEPSQVELTALAANRSVMLQRGGKAAPGIVNCPSFGGDKAPLIAVAFVDYTSPLAQGAAEMLHSFARTYGDQAKVHICMYPIPSDGAGSDAWGRTLAQSAATGALAAFVQGRFFEYDDALRSLGQPQGNSLEQAAEKAGLDLAQWKNDAASEMVSSMLEDQAALARALGVAFSPALFLNGQMLPVAARPQQVLAAAEEQLWVLAGEKMLDQPPERQRNYLASKFAGRNDKAFKQLVLERKTPGELAIAPSAGEQTAPAGEKERRMRELREKRADRGSARRDGSHTERPGTRGERKVRKPANGRKDRNRKQGHRHAAHAQPERDFKPIILRSDDIARLPTEAKGVAACPSSGSDGAKVTMLAFLDYSSTANKTALETLDRLGANPEVRTIICLAPGADDEAALATALALGAAHKQGKFDSYSALLAGQTEFGADKLASLAVEAGLDKGQYEADMASPELKKEIQRQSTLAAWLGADGMPYLFINGRGISGGGPFDAIKTVFDTNMGYGERMARGGTAPEVMHAALSRSSLKGLYMKYVIWGLTPEDPDPHPVYGLRMPTNGKLEIGDSPRNGSGDKLVIFEFSDFECPHCSKVPPVLDAVLEKLKGEASVVFKHYPLSFHRNAQLAAEASMAAHAQGRFWEYSDLLFANQKNLGRDALENYARQVGLNMEQFTADLDSHKYKMAVEADLHLGSAIGVSGTPTLFVNGRKFTGTRTEEAIISFGLGR